MEPRTADMSLDLTDFEVFEGIEPDLLRRLENAATRVFVPRGTFLVRQGEQADALYIVETGRFDVLRNDVPHPVAEIGAGRLVGEIAFFAGGARTANVRARRDSVVYRLGREDFDLLCAMKPALLRAVSQTLARRLARTTARAPAPPAAPVRPVTICVVQAGSAPIPDWFFEMLRAKVLSGERSLYLDDTRIRRAFGGDPSVDPGSEPTAWFNELEQRYRSIVYAADPELTPWTRKALRQADEVLLVGNHAETQPGEERAVNEVETYAMGLAEAGQLRLVLLHGAGAGSDIRGSRTWLDQRSGIAMHHHVEAGRADHLDRLFRFIDRDAVGLVASGGGAYTAGHIGLFQAATEAGIGFDVFSGTSGGSAMAAAFALGTPPEEVDRRTRWMFVEKRAMRLWTWPRYSLLDHSMMDRCLEELFGTRDIADMPVPFFAVSSSLKSGTLKVHRTGPLWLAIRASSAIPALLPPVFTEDGDVLVDGCLLDNVPLGPMRALKGGPNVVFEYRAEAAESRHVAPGALPSRWELMRGALNPALRNGRAGLEDVPGPHTILVQALMIHQAAAKVPLEPRDLLLSPMVSRDIGVLDWHRHSQLRWRAYDHAREVIAAACARGHALLPNGGHRVAHDAAN